MGHAGAIIMGARGTPESKISAFETAGVPVARTLQEIPALARKMLKTARS
jgi:succinyl-CoA synthetase alpha subunit